MRMKVVVCKVSLNSGNIFNLRKHPDDLREKVFKNINKSFGNIYKDGNVAYTMQKLEFEFIKNDNFIVGRLIKYKINNETEHWDDSSNKIIVKFDENSILDKVHYIYEKKSEYLFIEEKCKMEVIKSIEIFKRLVNYNNMELNIDVNPVLNKKEAKERIKQFDKITLAHFELIPNNPDQKLWRYFEQIAEKFASINSIHEFKNLDGLNYTYELEEAVEDVNEGKSRRYILGGFKENGKYDEVRSQDLIERKFKNVEPSTEGRMRGIWQVLAEIIDS